MLFVMFYQCTCPYWQCRGGESQAWAETLWWIAPLPLHRALCNIQILKWNYVKFLKFLLAFTKQRIWNFKIQRGIKIRRMSEASLSIYASLLSDVHFTTALACVHPCTYISVHTTVHISMIFLGTLGYFFSFSLHLCALLCTSCWYECLASVLSHSLCTCLSLGVHVF